MDLAFTAKYEVLEVSHGSYGGTTIEFEVYDHYGYPDFARYDTALLFVSRTPSEGTYVHEKYQYVPVYRTDAGERAGCGDPYRFDAEDRIGNVVADRVTFDPPVAFDLSKMSRQEIREQFPKQYFRVSEGKTICIRGAGLNDLLRIKMEGTFRKWGYGT